MLNHSVYQVIAREFDVDLNQVTIRGIDDHGDIIYYDIEVTYPDAPGQVHKITFSMRRHLAVSLRTDAATLPTRAHNKDAGLDLYAAEPIHLSPLERALVSTGLAIKIPDGHAGLVCPRSGLASKHGVTVLNSPGVIDPGYTGDVRVNLINLSSEEHTIHVGDRIAQLLIPEVRHLAAKQDDAAITDSERGDSGHGSTGA